MQSISLNFSQQIVYMVYIIFEAIYLLLIQDKKLYTQNMINMVIIFIKLGLQNINQRVCFNKSDEQFKISCIIILFEVHMRKYSTPSPPKAVISNNQNFQPGMMKTIQFTVAGKQQILLVNAMGQQLNIRNRLIIPQWACLDFKGLFSQQIRLVYYMLQGDIVWNKMQKILNDNDIKWKETESNPVEQGTKTYSDLAELIKRQLSSQTALIILKFDETKGLALIKKWLSKQFYVKQLQKRHYLIEGRRQERQSQNSCGKIVKINKIIWINILTVIRIILRQLYIQSQTSNLQELIFSRSEGLFDLIFKSINVCKSYKRIGEKVGVYLEGTVKSTKALRQLILQAYRTNVQQCILFDFPKENVLQLKREYPYTVLVQIFTYFYSKVYQRELKINKNVNRYGLEKNQISQEEKLKQLSRRRFFYEEENIQIIEQLIFDIMFLRKRSSNLQKYQTVREIIECIQCDINPKYKDDFEDSYWIYVTKNFGKLLSHEFKDKTTKHRKIQANTILEDFFQCFKNRENNCSLDSLSFKINFGFADPSKSEKIASINKNIYRNMIKSQRQQMEYINQSTLFNVVTKDLCSQPIQDSLECSIIDSSFVFTNTADRNLQKMEAFIESLWKKRKTGYIFLQRIKNLYQMNEEEQKIIQQQFTQYYFDILQIAQSYEQSYNQTFEIMSKYQLLQIQNELKVGQQINQIQFLSYPEQYWIITIAPD